VRAPRLKRFRHARPGKSPEHRRPERFQPRVAPHPEGRTRRKRQQMRQEIPHHVHHVDGCLLVRHGHVNVHPEDQQRPRQLPHLFHDVLVTLSRGNHLIDPAGKWVRSRRRYVQPRALGRGHKFSPCPVNLQPQFAHVLADLRPCLDDGLVHLAPDLVTQSPRRRGEQLHHVRAQLQRIRINNLEFFFDTDGEAVSHLLALRIAGLYGHFGANIIPSPPSDLHPLPGSRPPTAQFGSGRPASPLGTLTLMQISPFRIEEYMGKYEFAAKYLLSSSDAESQTIQEILALEPGAHDAFLNLWCGYTESPGAPWLRDVLATMYSQISSDQLVVLSAAEEAIFVFYHALLTPKDHAIVETPCY